MYMAPEIIQGGEQNVLSDLWSLGCIFYHMFAGNFLLFKILYSVCFQSNRLKRQYTVIEKKLGIGAYYLFTYGKQIGQH